MTIVPPLIDRYLVTLRQVGLDCDFGSHPDLKAIADQMTGEELILLGQCLVEEGKAMVATTASKEEA